MLKLECHKICLGWDGGMRPYPRLREQERESEREREREREKEGDRSVIHII